ncbi:MAG: hypothetical protein AUI03_08200 [Nitrospirae bacterium 13_2_20CM_2_62_8]|nr:MAG: hypothetical protein AUI03_08200 [Nitrospirae bacterium 13_2_20CM_2_62_8]
MILSLTILLSDSVPAQPPGHGREPVHHQNASGHDHAGVAGSGWEGSPEGKAYSDFNHHTAGVFVLLIVLGEFRYPLALTALACTRLLLPMAMLGSGGFLLIWSDHEAWPIGSLSFVQTFFGTDGEIVQHKLYAVLFLAVGLIELLRRIMAITAGSCKLASELPDRSRWGLAWACLILLIGVQLLFYSE